MSDEESTVKQVFKRYMAEELGSPEIRRAKRKLIDEHFGQPPVFIFRPVFLVPALSLIFTIMLIFQMHKPAVKPATEPLRAMSVEKPVSEIIPSISKGLEVKVSEVSSEVGAAMVYQKTYQNAPVTVIWVFTPLEVVSKPAAPLTGFTGGTNQ